MKGSFRTLIFFMAVSLICFSCTDVYITSRPTSGTGVVTPCEAPPIKQNIVGKWRFESTYKPFDKSNTVVTGTITFTDKGEIIDPDTLFLNYLDGIGYATSKTYKTNVRTTNPSLPDEYFFVYVNTKIGPETTPFTVIVNECKRVVLGLTASDDYLQRITLTR